MQCAQGGERLSLERQLGDLHCAQKLLAFIKGLVEAMDLHEDGTSGGCDLNDVRLLGDQLVEELVSHGASRARAEQRVQFWIEVLRLACDEPAGCVR